jgi:hypothetical protein
MARQFRFTNRWFTSLRNAYGADADDIRTRLDQRDLELEGFMDNAYPVAYFSTYSGAGYTTTTTPVSVTSLVVPMRRHDQALITGVFDVDAGTALFSGELYVNTVLQTGKAHHVGTVRDTVPQQWLYRATADGAVTFDLRASHIGGTGFTVRPNNTTLAVLHLR